MLQMPTVGFLCIILIGLLGEEENSSIAPLRRCATDVKAIPIQPQGVPILLEVTITNTSKKPIRYPTAKDSPPAGYFQLTVEDKAGKTCKVQMANHLDGAMSSVGIHRFLPSESVSFVAAIPPLPVGSYVLRVGNGKESRVTVKDDSALVRQRDQEVLQKVREGDWFSHWLVVEYPSESLIQKLVQDVSSGNVRTAKFASQCLTGIVNTAPNKRERPLVLSPKIQPAISEAIAKELEKIRKNQVPNTQLLRQLTFLAGATGSEEGIDTVLRMTQSDLGEGVRADAVASLGKFDHERATKELKAFLQDSSELVRFRAAEALAIKKSPQAITVLLAIVEDHKSRWRAHAIKSLAKFPEDPRVKPAITVALEDENDSVREAANHALGELQRTDDR